MKYLYNRRVASARFSRSGVKKHCLLITGVFVAAVTAASFNFGVHRAAATVPGNNTRVSLTGAGPQATQDSYQGKMSRDGRFITFVNAQNYFVGTDWNNAGDVFVRDLSSGTVTRVSVSTAGVSSDKGGYNPVISETGRYVVFISTSSNLIDGRTITVAPTNAQLYMRDTATNTTTILTEVSPGTFANNSGMETLDVSTDGRYVLFRTYATNLGPTITNGSHNNIFLLDRVTSSFSWVNAEGAGSGGYGNDTYDAHMSCDGSFIVFDSAASYLGLPSSMHVDVFLLDRRGGSRLTNITASANGAALKPTISCNGNHIGFASYASNLDPITAGMTLYYHAYSYDRINEQFRLVDQTSGGSLANASMMNLTSQPFYLSLSDKGTAVFGSTATNLDAAATSSQRQLFVRDPQAGTTELLTRSNGGTEGDNISQVVTMSLDGKLAGYESYATNLVSGDTNGVRDIFISETGL